MRRKKQNVLGLILLLLVAMIAFRFFTNEDMGRPLPPTNDSVQEESSDSVGSKIDVSLPEKRDPQEENSEREEGGPEKDSPVQSSGLDEDKTYKKKDDVIAYLIEFGHLPKNYKTKKEARALGWVSKEGNLDRLWEDACIGGDVFRNYEGQLPEGDRYYEADVNYEGGHRGPERLVFNEEGEIWYTPDHYKTFEKVH